MQLILDRQTQASDHDVQIDYGDDELGENKRVILTVRKLRKSSCLEETLVPYYEAVARQTEFPQHGELKTEW